MKVVPAFGGGIAGKSYPVTVQRRVNCYMEQRPDADKAQVVVYGTPGLCISSWNLLLDFAPAGVIRGIYGHGSEFYAVIGATLWLDDGSGNATWSSALTTVSGNVAWASTKSQVMMVDGAAGYTMNSTGPTVIASASFPNGCKTCAAVGLYFVVEKPGTQEFWVSALNDGQTWTGLSFATASQYPGEIKAVDALNGVLVVFCDDHCEFWQDVGASPQPFAPILSSTNRYGIASIWSRAQVANTLVYLAINPQGGYQVAQISGFSVGIISTPDLEYIIGTLSTVTDAVALSYVIGGHPMYQLTFPTDDRSFLYDCASGLWSETTGGVGDDTSRHRGQHSTRWNDHTIISDYLNNTCYDISEQFWYGNYIIDTTTGQPTSGTPIFREIVTRHGSENFNVFAIDEVFMEFETGVGLPVAFGGYGVSPMVTIECSKDNGRTWSIPRQLSLGAGGAYKTRVVARRWGSARDFVFRYRFYDLVKFVITAAAVTIRELPQ